MFWKKCHRPQGEEFVGPRSTSYIVEQIASDVAGVAGEYVRYVVWTHDGLRSWEGVEWGCYADACTDAEARVAKDWLASRGAVCADCGRYGLHVDTTSGEIVSHGQVVASCADTDEALLVDQDGVLRCARCSVQVSP